MKVMNRFSSLFLVITILSIVCLLNIQLSAQVKPKQPALGFRTVKLLTVEGLQFKDLNKNGTLDKYEDWRLSAEERSKDLISKMSLEEMVGFMLISTSRMKNDWAMGPPKSKDPITSDFNEEDLVTANNIFTRQALPEPMTSSAGTTKGVRDFHLRHFILRANVS